MMSSDEAAIVERRVAEAVRVKVAADKAIVEATAIRARARTLQRERESLLARLRDLQCVLTPTPDITVPKGPHNGYVRVPPGHPAAGTSYDAAEALFDLDVNGGLTYAYQCPDGGTWFGWDDMHLWRSPSPSACLHEALTLLGLESEDA